jgi:hypothetical protein
VNEFSACSINAYSSKGDEKKDIIKLKNKKRRATIFVISCNKHRKCHSSPQYIYNGFRQSGVE